MTPADAEGRRTGLVPPWLAVVLPVLLLAVLAWTASRPGEPTRDVQLAEAIWESRWQHTTLDLKPEALPDGTTRQTLSLTTSDPGLLANATQVQLLMATYNGQAHLLSAALRLGDGCVFRTSDGAALADNTPLTFERQEPCTPPAAPPKGGSLPVELEVHCEGAPHLAVWSATSSEPPYTHVLSAETTSDGKTVTVYPYGSYRPQPPARIPRRLELLSAMWGFGLEGWRTLAAIGLAGLLSLLLGCRLWTRPRLVPLAGSLLFFGFGVLFATSVPPFAAPDEPNHFLTLARLVGRADLAQGALDLARTGHLDRLTFRRAEKFAATDVGQPVPAPWSQHIGPTPPNRSYLTTLLWPKVALMFNGASAGLALLLVRLANVACVAGAIGLGALVVGRASTLPRWTGAVPFLFAPTVAFFSMHVSNFPYMICGFVLQAWALWHLLAGEGLSLRIGALLGSGVGLAVYAGVSGTTAVAFWILVVAARLIEARTAVPGRPAPRLRFLLGLVLGYGAVALLVAQTVGLDWRLEPLVVFFLAAAHVVTSHGVPVTALIVAACVGTALVAAAPRALARFVRPAGRAPADGPWKAPRRWAPLVVFGLVLIYTAVSHHSPTPNIELPHVLPPFASYGRKVVGHFLRGLGLGDTDPYVLQSFWGGFGWLEVVLPAPLIDLLRCLPLAGLAGLAVVVGRPGSCRFAWRWLATITGLATYLACLAYGYWQGQINLHGRYEIGVFLLLMELSVVSSGLALPRRAAWPAAIATLALCLFVQGYALVFLMTRYV